MTDVYSENVAGEKLVFLFGSGGSGSQTFNASCSINTNSKLDLTSDIYTGSRANCTNPSAPSKTTRRVKGTDVKFTGSGMTDAASAKVLVMLWKTGQPFDGKVLQDLDVGGFEIDGSWLIESLGLGGAHREDQAFDISIATTGDFDIT